jgi:hypothetical protein
MREDDRKRVTLGITTVSSSCHSPAPFRAGNAGNASMGGRCLGSAARREAGAAFTKSGSDFPAANLSSGSYFVGVKIFSLIDLTVSPLRATLTGSVNFSVWGARQVLSLQA